MILPVEAVAPFEPTTPIRPSWTRPPATASVTICNYFPVELTRQLIGLEGKRVEVVDRHGEPRADFRLANLRDGCPVTWKLPVAIPGGSPSRDRHTIPIGSHRRLAGNKVQIWLYWRFP